MNPDVVVGAGMVAAAAAGWGAFELGVHLALTQPASLEPESVSDDLAVARAVGVLVPADGGRSSGQMAADIARLSSKAAGEAIDRAFWKAAGEAGVLDHVLCEGMCGQVLCCCRPFDGPRCAGTVEQVCGHLNPLCADCSLRECVPCLGESTDHWFGGNR